MTTIEARYRDPSLPIDARVADLLARMTLDEKLAQLGSLWSFELFSSETDLDPERLRDRLAEGIGQVSRVAGATNLDAAGAAEAGNAIQRFLVEETRLGIPAILHEEALHGLLARGATSFQQSIGAAAAFDPELVEAIATTIRRRMLAIGGRLALAPVLDITRDPRWGRVEETYGEDPYLATALGVAYVRGMQGDDVATGVVATGKHLVGHGLAEGGLNQAPAHAGPRELRDEQLVPFEAAVREAGLACVMPAYCDVDGLPCHASGELLTTILRDEWGFDGIVASDYTAVQMLVGEHRLTADLGTAAAMAVRAGSTASCRRPPGSASRSARRSRTGGSTAASSTSRSSASCGSSSGWACSSGRTSTRRRSPRWTSSRRRSARSRPSSSGGRSCCWRTTACCRWRPTAGGSPSSGRSPTAPGTSWATTRTCRTSRRWPSCATGPTRSASRRAT